MEKKPNQETNLWLVKPIGEILQDAGLISQYQIEIGLIDQNSYIDKKLGEIFALRGWVKQKTTDFFVEDFARLATEQEKMKLGEYFRVAGLLDEEQIEEILKEQVQIGIKFGYVAVLKGYIKQETLDFFLTHLIDKANEKSDIIHKNTLIQKDTKIVEDKHIAKVDPSECETVFDAQQEEKDSEDNIKWLH